MLVQAGRILELLETKTVQLASRGKVSDQCAASVQAHVAEAQVLIAALRSP